MHPYTITPTLQTCWQHHTPEGKKSYRVTGIWGKGFLSNYQVVSYELSPLGGGQMLTVKAEKMRQLIEDKTLTLI